MRKSTGGPHWSSPSWRVFAGLAISYALLYLAIPACSTLVAVSVTPENNNAAAAALSALWAVVLNRGLMYALSR